MRRLLGLEFWNCLQFRISKHFLTKELEVELLTAAEDKEQKNKPEKSKSAV